MKTNYQHLSLLLLMLAVYRLNGQDAKTTYPVINTDRPTQAFSPYIVPQGTLQIETGFSFEQESNDNDDLLRYDLAGTQLRYGLFDNFELRAFGFYSIKEISPKSGVKDSTLSGFGPLRLGFKVHVVEEDGWRPEMAVIANLTLRHIGEEEFAPVFSYPIASILFANTLAGNLSLVYNAGFAYSGKNADGFFIYRVALNYAVLDKLVLFVEPYGNFDQGDLPNHKLNGGLMYLLANNLQLDVSYGIGFSKDISKSFGGIGLSWRIPH